LNKYLVILALILSTTSCSKKDELVGSWLHKDKSNITSKMIFKNDSVYIKVNDSIKSSAIATYTLEEIVNRKALITTEKGTLKVDTAYYTVSNDTLRLTSRLGKTEKIETYTFTRTK